MVDALWFFHHAGSQRGPISWSELQMCADRGEILPDDLVWQPELSDWQPAGSIVGLFSESSGERTSTAGSRGRWQAGSPLRRKPATLVILRPAEAGLWMLARVFSTTSLAGIDNLTMKSGLWIYLTAALVATVLLLEAGIRERATGAIVLAIITMPAALLAGYSANRFLLELRILVRRLPTRIPQNGLLESLAAISLAASMFTLGLSAWSGAMYSGGERPVIAGAAGILLLYVAGVCLSPSSINVVVTDENGTRSDEMSSLEFLAKLILAGPVAAAFAITATAALILTTLKLIKSIRFETVTLVAAATTGVASVGIALIPFVAWLAYMIVWTTLLCARSHQRPDAAAEGR